MDQFGCPHSRDPASRRAGTGGPAPGSTFKNLKTGAVIARNADGCIPDEYAVKISNKPGTFSMANTGSPESGGSQFFMNVADNAFLDFFSPGASKHPVFGKAADAESYKTIVAISTVKTVSDKPVTPIVMKSVTIAGI